MPTRQPVKEYYQEIISQLKAHRGKLSKFFGSNYDGHNDPSWYVPNPVMRKIAKGFVNRHPNITLEEFLKLLDLLNQGKYSTEKSFGGMLLQYTPKLRAKVNPQKLNQWLNNLEGWSQVDSLCQSVFSAQDLSLNWKEWKKTITRFSKDKNINKRRASLVLLTAPVRQSTEGKFSQLAFLTIERLKAEKEILITKAISWLLREMTKNHQDKVAAYLKHYELTLPRMAVRETKRKLETGKK